MLVKSQAKIGGVNYQFECDEKSEKESFAKAIVFGNPPIYCELCKNSDPAKFRMETNKDKDGHIYIKIRCKGCGATCGLGEYKDGSGYFWRKPFEKYIPKNATVKSAAPTEEPGPTDAKGEETINPDDIPF